MILTNLFRLIIFRCPPSSFFTCRVVNGANRARNVQEEKGLGLPLNLHGKELHVVGCQITKYSRNQRIHNWSLTCAGKVDIERLAGPGKRYG
ncbi:hypothetical protein EJ065_2063 [Corallococcus coralloides]|uniref:Uncharacterized protein n=1 Tax=Corallococcus coralloides TaxID=184914 RepID=A0A410RNY5_CORCK|nr:hypothetical protein EJ065_2063 [Corallococcus coralloides]